MNPDFSKYSTVIADWLVKLGYTHCLMVAGGGCMHLIDGFRTRFTCIPVVHEVTAGVAAEHFNECSSSGKAFALVTTGPGLTNVVTAIAGCYSERRELLVICGQVKSNDLLVPPLRQRGIQEVDGVALTKSITVASACLKEPIGYEAFSRLVKRAWGPLPGPVVIEICLDVQGALVDKAELEASGDASEFAFSAPGDTPDLARHIAKQATIISRAKRPVILLGGLVSRQLAWKLFPEFLRLGIPVMTTTSAIDRMPSSAAIWAGRPGTWGGQRSANMLIAQADVILAIGAQLDLQQTGFNWEEYAPDAQLCQVFPCTYELTKGHPKKASTVDADPNTFLEKVIPLTQWQDEDGWGEYVRDVQKLLPVLEPANTNGNGFASPFEFLRNLSLAARADDVLAMSSSGGSFTGALQMYETQLGQIATTSAALASMGYGLGTAIGCALGRPGQRVLLVEGDGGFSQNLQELAIVRLNNLPIKLFVLDNDGYGSIRATQRKFFGGAYVGCDKETGLGFPNWPHLFGAYGISASYLDSWKISVETLSELIDGPEPEAWIVRVDPEQSNWPAVSTKILPDGKMVSNPLYKMLPTLEAEVLEKVSRYLPRE